MARARFRSGVHFAAPSPAAPLRCGLRDSSANPANSKDRGLGGQAEDRSLPDHPQAAAASAERARQKQVVIKTRQRGSTYVNYSFRVYARPCGLRSLWARGEPWRSSILNPREPLAARQYSSARAFGIWAAKKKGAYLCWLSHRGNGEVSTVPITVPTDLQWSQPHAHEPRFPSGLRHRHHARSYGGKFYAC